MGDFEQNRDCSLSNGVKIQIFLLWKWPKSTFGHFRTTEIHTKLVFWYLWEWLFISRGTVPRLEKESAKWVLEKLTLPKLIIHIWVKEKMFKFSHWWQKSLLFSEFCPFVHMTVYQRLRGCFWDWDHRPNFQRGFFP